ncbi:MAG: peptidoglycan DD-metalloendopeptidase family protein, partial [Chloroflexia bacterium]
FFSCLTLLGHGYAGYGFRNGSTAEGGSSEWRVAAEPSRQEQDEAFAFAVAPITSVGTRATLEISETVTETEPLARSEAITYTVVPGDTLEGLAERFEVAAYTIFWVNHLRTPRDVIPGRVLVIPPISGVPHTVQPGETLQSIADRYGVRPGNIVGYPPNGLKYPYHLQVGQEIFVPGAAAYIPAHPAQPGEQPQPLLIQMPGGEKLRWPTWGEITAPFGWSRSYRGYHHGLDIANRLGTPILAAASGTVIESGWDSLGWHVVIDHGNGFQTIYGHLAERPMVHEGDHVEKGQQIGLMGRTYGRGGYASGVHLHFAVRHHGAYVDPLPLLE